jgi:flagellar biosynthesis protein FlhB
MLVLALMELVILEQTVPRMLQLNAEVVIKAGGWWVTIAYQIFVLVLMVLLQLERHVDIIMLTSAKAAMVIKF